MHECCRPVTAGMEPAKVLARKTESTRSLQGWPGFGQHLLVWVPASAVFALLVSLAQVALDHCQSFGAWVVVAVILPSPVVASKPYQSVNANTQ